MSKLEIYFFLLAWASGVIFALGATLRSGHKSPVKSETKTGNY